MTRFGKNDSISLILSLIQLINYIFKKRKSIAMEFGLHFNDESNDGDIFLDEIPFQIESERKSKKRKEDEISSSPTLPSDTTSMSVFFFFF